MLETFFEQVEKVHQKAEGVVIVMNDRNKDPTSRNHWVSMCNNDILNSANGGTSPDHFMSTYISRPYPQAEKLLQHYVTKGMNDGAFNYVMQYRGVVLTTCAIAAGYYRLGRKHLWPVHPVNKEVGRFFRARGLEHSLYTFDDDGNLLRKPVTPLQPPTTPPPPHHPA